MDVKKVFVAMVVLLFAATAYAVAPDVNVLTGDTNYFYPSKTNTIEFVISGDAASDANIGIYYMATPGSARVSIVDLNGVDGNLMNYCVSPISATRQTCSYNWTLPVGLDSNYFIDVNVMDIENGSDLNDSSKQSLYIDSNACDTQHSVVEDVITLTSVCTGLSGDVNALGTLTIFQGSTRQGKCPSSYDTYTAPFTKNIGEHTVCYYSTDGIGNTEVGLGFTQTFDSGAYNLAVLAEMLLAALLIFVIIGGIVLRGEDLSGTMMLALLSGAVVIAIGIYIFAVIL